MRKIVLLALILVSLTAGVYYQSLTLLSLTGQTTTVTGSILGFDPNFRPGMHSGLACRLTTKNNSGTLPTLDAKIQTCKTAAGADCEDLCVFTQRTTQTSGGETIWLDKDIYGAYGFHRGISALGGTNPNYDVTIELVHE
jgi:hypothetical protein